MRVFIVWSGRRSKLLAEALHAWLPDVIQAVEPWLSTEDIGAGERWGPEITAQLDQTHFGVVCLAADNLEAPWVHFEAGALSKTVGKAKVAPYLLDVKQTDVKGPLAQFQAFPANKTGTKRIVEGVNDALRDSGGKPLSEAQLLGVFEKWWPDLGEKIRGIPPASEKLPQRDMRELVEEVLLTVRDLAKRPTFSEQVLRTYFPPSDLPTGTYGQAAYGHSAYGSTTVEPPVQPEMPRTIPADEPPRSDEIGEFGEAP